MNKVIGIVASVALGCLSTSSLASSMLWQYESTVNATQIGLGANENVRVQFGFSNPAQSDGTGINPSTGIDSYARYKLDSLTVLLGGYSATVQNIETGRNTITVSNDNALDAYNVGGYGWAGTVFTGLVNGHNLRSLNFSLSNLLKTTWSSVDLVTSIDLLNSFEFTAIGLVFDSDQGPSAYATGSQSTGQYSRTAFTVTDITSHNAVPEPASLALVGFSLAGLMVSRRRKVY